MHQEENLPLNTRIGEIFFGFFREVDLVPDEFHADTNKPPTLRGRGWRQTGHRPVGKSGGVPSLHSVSGQLHHPALDGWLRRPYPRLAILPRQRPL